MAEELTHLTIAELEAGIDDLLNVRAPTLAQLPSAGSYVTLLGQKREALRALPDALRGLPRADLLRALDLTHDRHVRALDLYRRFLEVWPQSTPELLAVAKLLYEQFVSGGDESQAAYAIEAQRAAERAPKIEAHKAALDGATMPDGSKLSAALTAYCAAGVELGVTHSGRADDLAKRGDGSNAGALRNEVIALVADLRTAIQRDLQANPALPRTLAAEAMGYLDELQRMARARSTTPPGAVEPQLGGAAASPQAPAPTV